MKQNSVSLLPELSKKSGVGVHYTNHSLRATAITRMFNCGIPEKVIVETSGDLKRLWNAAGDKI